MAMSPAWDDGTRGRSSASDGKAGGWDRSDSCWLERGFHLCAGVASCGMTGG